MKLHVHHLAGCTAEPLASYLKALGVLRAVAEQADRGARGRWKDGAFQLVSALDPAALARFFLEEFSPSPLVAPWNGGSGFYPKDAKQGIDPLGASEAARFAPYREAIASGRRMVAGRTESPKGDEKLEMIRACRRAWTGPMLDWLDAAVALTGDQAKYPALLGTGGNDGRLDFTNNRMQRILDLLDPAAGAPLAGARELLAAAFYGEPAPGLKKCAAGQFLPGNAGGPNQTAGFDGDALVNPWDFVLLFEGALLLPVAAVRRLEGAGLPQAAAAFAVRARAGGYASACAADEANQRGEQWMPLWGGAATLPEVRALFTEGRLVAGKGRAQAGSAIDAARAVTRLGVARGVSEFVRFGYIERNGQANLAVPLGHWTIEPAFNAERPSFSRLLDEIDPWVEGLRSASRANTAPASLGRAVRQIEAAMLAVCREGSPERWQRLLLALAEAEATVIARPRSAAELARVGLIPPLSPAWSKAAGHGTPEVRLALAIASQTGPAGPIGADRFGPIRAHCLPLDPRSGYRRLAVGAEGLLRDRRVVWTGRDLTADLGAVALRRLVEAAQEGAKAFPLRGRVFAAVDDVVCFLDGAVDEARIAGLARALMAIAWREPRRASDRPFPERASALHALFRVVYAPEALRPQPPSSRGAGAGLPALTPRLDPAPLRLLLAGRLEDAAGAALRALVAAGARPKLRFAAGSPELARRLAASLAIPIASGDLSRLLERVCKPDAALPADDPVSPPVPTSLE